MKKLTKEERKQKVRDKIHDLVSKKADISSFSYAKLMMDLKFTKEEFRDTIDSLIREKVILRKYVSFSIFIPNDNNGKNIIKRFEKELKIRNWFDRMAILGLSSFLLMIISSFLMIKFPSLVLSLLGTRKTQLDYVFSGLMYGSILTIFLFMILNIIIMWINSLGLRKIIFSISGILIIILAIYSATKNATALNTFVTLIGIMVGIYSLFKETIDKWIDNISKSF